MLDDALVWCMCGPVVSSSSEDIGGKNRECSEKGRKSFMFHE